ncbi:hypothetical protein J1N35_014263 [Gossypium stocksii]|uniref:Uncharacterized protein n=1 Tax=Gossypium stocksii TaxID=47602 RepID=A0A9D4A9R3_9ROSI|nr:hypothetical protein J1N35_014263 [Gossypium stocksii]
MIQKEWWCSGVWRVVIVGGVVVIRLLEFSMSEGVFVSMSLKGISMVVSNRHSDEGSRKVPTRNGLVAPATKFKQRKVSVVWDFPPGCSRVAAPIARPSGQATIV